ncbi:UNKNOWN [Stylonychia lemnae]|uniref:Uncharacterized protein n=1 Tax=Stylonychia lemnae TaxID=5949 RepID=A0A078AYK9_STYLE|nr:UNKNOWN [Stylonychia lemnae]|eukprot:CDW86297.1 UNKNOWN [Stylonychia lemnae]
MNGYELTEQDVRQLNEYFMITNDVDSLQRYLEAIPNLFQLFEQQGLPIPKHHGQGVQLGEVGSDKVKNRPSGFNSEPKSDRINDRRSYNAFGNPNGSIR